MDPDRRLLPPGADARPPLHPPGSVGPSHAWQRPAEEPTDYVRVFMRRRRVLLATFAGVFALAAAYTFSQPRVYQATARVHVVEPTPSPLERARTPEERSLSLQAHQQVLFSSLVAQQAAERLGQGVTVDEIMSGLSVSALEPDALAIEVEHRDPQRAALIANAMQDAFIDYSRVLARADLTGAREFLESRRRIVEADLRRTETATKQFKATHNVQEMDPTAMARAQMAYTYRAEAEQARAELQAAVAALASFRRRLASEKPTRKVTRVVEDLALQGLRQEIAKLDVELTVARTRYEDAHPRVQTLNDRLQALRAQEQQRRSQGDHTRVETEEPNPAYAPLQEQVREQETRVATLRARASALASTSAATASGLPGTPTTYMELMKLEQAKATADRAYGQLMEQLMQARLSEASHQGPIRKLDIAWPPRVPIRPRPASTLAMAAVAALVAAIAVVVLQESADTNIDDPDELMRGAGIRTLGLIPAMREAHRSLQVAAQSPASLVAEGYRMVWANLAAASRGYLPGTVMVTSAGPREGKSSCAMNLATVIAQAGMSTLLVDADLRRPTLHGALQQDIAPGLSNVLVGETSLRDAVRSTSIENLRLLPAGDTLWNPAALLGSPRMAELVQEMKDHAQVVVLDAPPTLAVADAVILSPHADATILVIAQNKVPCRALVEVRSIVEGAGGHLVGAVFNKVRRVSGDWYTHYYYSYHSGGKHRNKLLITRKPDSHAAPTAEI